MIIDFNASRIEVASKRLLDGLLLYRKLIRMGADPDVVCSRHPYFRIPDEKLRCADIIDISEKRK